MLIPPPMSTSWHRSRIGVYFVGTLWGTLVLRGGRGLLQELVTDCVSGRECD